MDILFHTREFNRNYHKGQYLLAGFRISPLPYFLIQAKLVGMNLDSEIKVGASADAPVVFAFKAPPENVSFYLWHKIKCRDI